MRTFSGHLQDQIQTLAFAANQINSETSNFGRNVQGLESNVVQVLVQSMDQIKALTAEMADVVQGSSGNITYHLKATSSEIASLIERTGITLPTSSNRAATSSTQGLQNVAGDFLDKIARTHGDLINYLDQTSTQIVVGVEARRRQSSGRPPVDHQLQFLTGMDQTANQILYPAELPQARPRRQGRGNHQPPVQ